MNFGFGEETFLKKKNKTKQKQNKNKNKTKQNKQNFNVKYRCTFLPCPMCIEEHFGIAKILYDLQVKNMPRCYRIKHSVTV